MERKSMTERLKDAIRKEAARWEENVSFQKKLKEEFLNNPDFDDAVENIEYVDDFMILLSEDIEKLPKRVQKFVSAYCNYIGNGNVYQNSLGKYLEEILDIEDYYNGFSYNGYGEYGNSEIDIIDLLKKNLGILDVKSDINFVKNAILNVKVDDDIEKAQKQKVLKTITVKGDKLIKSCNDFKMLVDKELSSNNGGKGKLFEANEIDLVDNIPFWYIVNVNTNTIADHDGANATNITEMAKFTDKSMAEDSIERWGEENYKIMECNNMKEYKQLLNSLGE